MQILFSILLYSYKNWVIVLHSITVSRKSFKLTPVYWIVHCFFRSNKWKKKNKKTLCLFFTNNIHLLQDHKASRRKQVNSNHQTPWCSFYQPQKDKRLSRSWDHLMVLSMGPFGWKLNVMTTKSLLFNMLSNFRKIIKRAIFSYIYLWTKMNVKFEKID